jgi:hypothetical protein
LNVKQLRHISTVEAAGWDPAALRTEKQKDQDIWPFLGEVETGQRPEWRDIADRSPRYKSYWAQWKSLGVRNGILAHHWKSTDGRYKMLTDGGPSGGHLGVNKTLNKVRQKYYWPQAINDIEMWCR